MLRKREAVDDRLGRIEDPDRHRTNGVGLDTKGECLFAEAGNPDRRGVDRWLAVLRADCDPDAARQLQRDLMKLERRYEADHAFGNTRCDLGHGMRNVDIGVSTFIEPSRGALEDALVDQARKGSGIDPAAFQIRGV